MMKKVKTYSCPYCNYSHLLTASYRSHIRMVHEPSIQDMLTIKGEFWRDGKTWNASTADLPIAVTGTSLKKAHKNLQEAIRCHFETIAEVETPDCLGRMLMELMTGEREK